MLLLAILFVWSLFEFVTGAPFWGIIFGGIGAVATWRWFFDGWPETSATDTASDKPVDTKAAARDGADSVDHE